MPVSGLSRLLSFEEEDGQQLHLEIKSRLPQAAATADSSDAPALAVEPPPLPPAAVEPPPAPLLGSEQQQACRAQQMQQLQKYLDRLVSTCAGSDGGSSALVQFPPELQFRGLVQQLLQARLAECSEQRGGLDWAGLCNGMHLEC